MTSEASCSSQSSGWPQNAVFDPRKVVSEQDSANETPQSGAEEDPWLIAMRKFDEERKAKEKVGSVVNNRYKVIDKLSFGSYGSIYRGVDIETNEKVALKFESQLKESEKEHLKYESRVYESLLVEPHPEGIAKSHYFGKHQRCYLLVMDLLGPSLEQLFGFCRHRFSDSTALRLGRQMLARIKHVHERGFVHRDIKPSNFLIGLGQQSSTVFLIDFGLSRRYRYRDATGGLRHIPMKTGGSLIGTAIYASVNAHRGHELSRRDDLESLAYMIIHFLGVKLPWMDLDKNKQKKHQFKTKKNLYNRIKRIKESTSPWHLCRTLAPEMTELLDYCQNLGFEESPDYEYIDTLLIDAMKGQRNPDSTFDWDRELARDKNRRYTFECSFAWTLPDDREPSPPKVQPGFGRGGFDFSANS